MCNLAAHPTTSVHWDAYKMDGNLEQENGDVAFLIEADEAQQEQQEQQDGHQDSRTGYGSTSGIPGSARA